MGESHDPAGPVDPEVLHDILLGLTEDVRARFGEREPTEGELRAFLAERLRSEGKSDREVEEILGTPDA